MQYRTVMEKMKGKRRERSKGTMPKRTVVGEMREKRK